MKCIISRVPEHLQADNKGSVLEDLVDKHILQFFLFSLSSELSD